MIQKSTIFSQTTQDIIQKEQILFHKKLSNNPVDNQEVRVATKILIKCNNLNINKNNMVDHSHKVEEQTHLYLKSEKE